MKPAIAISVGLGLGLTLLASGSGHAQDFAAKGTKATLTVTYEYSAIGKNADKSEPSEWRVSRTLTMVVPMSAEAEQALSSTRELDSSQRASLDKKQAQVASVHKKMEPTMNDMMKIADRCGEDEACIEKAIVEYGNRMDPSLVKSTKGDVDAAMKLDAPPISCGAGCPKKARTPSMRRIAPEPPIRCAQESPATSARVKKPARTAAKCPRWRRPRA